MKLLFISKYAATPECGNPSRQYFFASELAKMGHEVLLVNSISNGQQQLGAKRKSRFIGTKTDNRQQTTDSVIPSFQESPAGAELKAAGGTNPESEANRDNGQQTTDNGNPTALQILTLPGPEITLGMNWLRIWSWFWFEVQLVLATKKFRRFKPDVVLVSSLSFLSFWNGIRLKKRFHIPLAIEIRDLYPLTLIEVGGMSVWHPVVMLMARLEKRAYQQADVIVSSLENAIEHVRNVLGAEKFLSSMVRERFLWLPMGWEEGLFQAVNEDENSSAREIVEEVRRMKGEGTFVVGYAGTFGEANAMDGLLELSHNEEIVEANIAFVMIGGGPKADEYCRRYAGVNVRFYPAIPKKHLPSVLSECNLLFNAWLKRDIYSYGISPNKWIDYMYAARPILLALSAKSTIFRQARCGWQIEAENRDDLKKSLLGIRGLTKLELDHFGRNGRLFLERELNYKELSRKLEEKLQAAIDGE